MIEGSLAIQLADMFGVQNFIREHIYAKRVLIHLCILRCLQSSLPGFQDAVSIQYCMVENVWHCIINARSDVFQQELLLLLKGNAAA
jgi:hypothetical protein